MQVLPKIILIHGIASKRFWMTFLARKLGRLGYETETWGYNSLVGDFQKHAGRLRQHLEKQSREFHLVAHSMGSIITRVAISEMRQRLKRVVLIAPPNQGAPIARLLSPLVHPICPAMTQMSTSPDSFVRTLAPHPDVSMAVIAASHDVLVPKGNTYLEDVDASITMAGSHNSLLFQQSVALKVDHFLRFGCF